MNEDGLWTLFFATGLPEAYLALQGQRLEREQELEQPARTAFCGKRDGTAQI